MTFGTHLVFRFSKDFKENPLARKPGISQYTSWHFSGKMPNVCYYEEESSVLPPHSFSIRYGPLML